VTGAQDGIGERCPRWFASHLGHDDPMCRLGNSLIKISNNFCVNFNCGSFYIVLTADYGIYMSIENTYKIGL
jgi:hypothetical protein